MSGRAHLGLLGPPYPGGDRFPSEGVGINGVARGRGNRVTVTSSALRIVKILELVFLRELTPCQRSHFGLSSALLSPILSVTMDGKGRGGRRWTGNTYWRISRGRSIRNCCCVTST